MVSVALGTWIVSAAKEFTRTVQKLKPENEDFGAKRRFKVKLNLKQLKGGIRNFYKPQRKHKLKRRQLELVFQGRQALRKLKLAKQRYKQIISKAVVSGFTFPRFPEAGSYSQATNFHSIQKCFTWCGMLVLIVPKEKLLSYRWCLVSPGSS